MTRRLCCLCALFALVVAACSDGDPATPSPDAQDDTMLADATDTAEPDDTADATDTDDVAPDTEGDATDTADGTDTTDTTDAADMTDTVDPGLTDEELWALLGLDTPDTSMASFDVRGTLEQIYIWNAPPETAIEVVDAADTVIATGTTDTWGSLVVRELEPADDLIVRLVDTPQDVATGVDVLGPELTPPPQAFFEGQRLEPGFGYITTRDGTRLSIYVQMPGPPEDGPYPTLVNYSGYSPSKPGEVVSPEAELFCGSFPVLCDAPGHPSGLLAGIGGYATVGVNMRGTGCSGGAYDYFEPLQLTDGYDIIEIVAAQPWVKHNHVGMAGLSYPGISQLFVAAQNPPSLAAISPMSVLADSATSVLAPGGIYNEGFALAWIDNVLDRARPYGHDWVQQRVDDGDTICEENQLLHDQMVDVVAKALANPFYTDETARPLDPSSFVGQIDVPVYLTGQWQDEQTGPHFAALLDKFTASPQARFTVTNGVHIDGYTPQILMEWKSFLDFYVAQELPYMDPLVRDLIPLFFESSAGAPLELGPNRFEDYTDYATALADYESEPALRVIWESGANETYDPGAPAGRFETHHTAWPLPETTAVRWYLQPDGTLADTLPPNNGKDSSFTHDPTAATRTTLASGSVNGLQPNWDYQPLREGYALAFESAELTEDVVMLGHGSVDLWLKSTATDADIEVHLTEIRPDGQEMLVQSGWLRASHRTLREDATELRPVKTHREADYTPLVPDEWTEMRVEIMPFGHIFRAGSKVRLSIDTPGDTTAEWFWILLPHDESVVHTIGHDDTYPSSVVLPVIPNVTVPTDLAPCSSLRGQPCRTYVAIDNSP